MIKEFKEFLLRGNLLDLAVAVVIGAAFTAVVASITSNIITPLIKAIFGAPRSSAASTSPSTTRDPLRQRAERAPRLRDHGRSRLLPGHRPFNTLMWSRHACASGSRSQCPGASARTRTRPRSALLHLGAHDDRLLSDQQGQPRVTPPSARRAGRPPTSTASTAGARGRGPCAAPMAVAATAVNADADEARQPPGRGERRAGQRRRDRRARHLGGAVHALDPSDLGGDRAPSEQRLQGRQGGGEPECLGATRGPCSGTTGIKG